MTGIRGLSKVYGIAGIGSTEALRVRRHGWRVGVFLGNWSRSFNLVVYHYQATNLKTGPSYG